MPKRERFDAARFGKVVEANARTFAELQEMYKKKLIGEHDRLFTLDDVLEIAFVTFKGGWFNCRLQQNPKSKWSAETGARQARESTKEAF